MMRTLLLVLSVGLVTAVIGITSADEKKAANKQKIVGTWELVKSTSEPASVAQFGSSQRMGRSVTRARPTVRC